MKKLLKIVVPILIFTLVACGDDDPNNLPAPTKGSISGEVDLYDEGTTALDNSGMIVSAGAISATTDSDGKFVIEDVPFGEHIITFEKNDYGTYKFFAEHTNESSHLPAILALGKISKTEVITVETEVDVNDIVIKVMTSGTTTDDRYLRFFFSTDSNVNSTNYMAASPNELYEGLHTEPFINIVTQEELISLGFAIGTTVYVKVYGESFWSNEYIDLGVNYRIFPNLNMTSADPVSFEVPQ